MRFIIPFKISFWVLLASSVALGSTQHTTIVNLAQMPKWQVEKTQTVSLADVRQWGVEPEVDREYGVKKVEIRTYRRDKEAVQAVIEKAADPSSAYGLLTFYQNESMTPEKGMKLTVVGPDQAYLARGVFFVRVRRPSKPKMSNEDFRSFLISVAGKAPSANSMALLPPPLPPKGLIHGSEKYILGPVAERRALPFFPADLVGFNKGAELQAAAYHGYGKSVTFIFISYPTTVIARSHYRTIVHSFRVGHKNETATLYGKREGSYVLLAYNAPSRKAASELMSGLTIKQEVSWDQPAPGKPTTVQMFHLILGNILLVVLMVGMAIFTGLLLVLSRRIAAKWFPHWEWARGYEDSITRLNLK